VQGVWTAAGEEPALNEILYDPIVELVMRRDRISRGEVLRAVHTARARLGLHAPEPVEALAS
jgi:hypothetical protein